MEVISSPHRLAPRRPEPVTPSFRRLMDPSLAPLDARRLVELPMIARLEPCQACPIRAVLQQATFASAAPIAQHSPSHISMVLRSWQDTPLGIRQRRVWQRLGARCKTFELVTGEDAQVVGTVVAGNPLPARSGPRTTTMSRPATFATGMTAVSGWTAVIGTPSSEATSAAAGCCDGT
jgi:hypothetical protein